MNQDGFFFSWLYSGLNQLVGLGLQEWGSRHLYSFALWIKRVRWERFAKGEGIWPLETCHLKGESIIDLIVSKI